MELGQLTEPKSKLVFSLASVLSTRILFTSKNMGASECLDLLELCCFDKRHASRSGSLGEAFDKRASGRACWAAFDKRAAQSCDLGHPRRCRFFANILHLPHWNTQFPCHECDCQKPVYKKVPCPEEKSVKLLKEEEQDFKYVSPQEAFENKRSTHDLFQIPGVSTALVRGDSLHILYSRGVASHLAGSLLHYIIFSTIQADKRYLQHNP